MEVAEKCQILQNQVFCVGDVEHILQGLELRPPSRLHFVALGEPWNCRLWRWKIFLYTVNYSSSILLLICVLMIASTKKVPKTTLRTPKFIIFFSWKTIVENSNVSNSEMQFLMCSLCFLSPKNWRTLLTKITCGKLCSIYMIRLIPFGYLNCLLFPHTSGLWNSLLSCKAMKISRKAKVCSLIWFNTSEILKS